MRAITASPRNQKGFSLLTGFILAIIMFGTLAFFLAGQGINAGFGSAYGNQSKASGLLVSAGYLGTGFDAVVLSGQLPSAVTYDTVTNTGILNPTSGGAAQQSLDPTLFARQSAIDGYWVYRGNSVIMKGVGTTGVGDYTIMVSGLKKAICQQLNNFLHGTSLTTNPTSLGLTDANVIGAPTAGSPTTVVALDMEAIVAVTGGRTSGCFATTTAVGADVNYVHVHTLLPQ